MKKRILFVNVSFPPQSRGGASRVIESNINCMINDNNYEPCGVFCTLIGNQSPNRHETWVHSGVPVFAAASPLRTNMELLVHREDMKAPFTGFLDRVQPDLVHFHCIQRMGLEMVDIVKSRGIPSIITMHDGWWVADHLFIVDDDLRLSIYDYRNNLPVAPRRRMAALKSAIAKFDRVLTVSQNFSEIIKSTGLCDEIVINENGVSPLKLREKTAADKVRVLYMGGIDKRKGYHFLRAAFLAEQFPNVEVTMVDHSRRTGFSRTGRWNATDTRTVGYVSADKVAEFYQNADVVIVPSLWPESFNLVSREASLCGCWVFASSLGATGNHIVPGLNGYTFSTDRLDELIELLRELERNPEKFKTLVKPVPLRTVEDQYQELRSMYDQVIAIHGHAQT